MANIKRISELSALSESEINLNNDLLVIDHNVGEGATNYQSFKIKPAIITKDYVKKSDEEIQLSAIDGNNNSVLKISPNKLTFKKNGVENEVITELDVCNKYTNGEKIATITLNGDTPKKDILIPQLSAGDNIVLEHKDDGYLFVSSLDTTYELATETTDGLMSSADKNKLDNLYAYIQKLEKKVEEMNSNPEEYLRINSNYFYNAEKIDLPRPTTAGEQELHIIDVKQHLIMRLELLFNPKIYSTATDVDVRIEILIKDPNEQNESYKLFDTIIMVDKEYKTDQYNNYSKWIDCDANTSIKIKAYAKTSGKNSDAWNGFKLNIYEYSESPIKTFTTYDVGYVFKEQGTVTNANRHIVTEVFPKINSGIADLSGGLSSAGNLVVNGKCDFWNADNGHLTYNGWHYWNNYIGQYTPGTNKLLKYIPVRIIPTLTYAQKGQNKNNTTIEDYYYRFETPAFNNYYADKYMYVMESGIEISDIACYENNTTKWGNGISCEYRFTGDNALQKIFKNTSLTSQGGYGIELSTHFVSDTNLYNALTDPATNKANAFTVALVKVTKEAKEGNEDHMLYGEVIQTIKDDVYSKSYQFDGIKVNVGEKYVIVYNSWSNDHSNNVYQKWNFNYCVDDGTQE